MPSLKEHSHEKTFNLSAVRRAEANGLEKCPSFTRA
jgi:hypothetical protein